MHKVILSQQFAALASVMLLSAIIISMTNLLFTKAIQTVSLAPKTPVCFASLTFFDLPMLQHRLLTLILAPLPSSYPGSVFIYAQHITQLGIGKASALRQLTSGFGKFLI